jgi:hypothetical protein
MQTLALNPNTKSRSTELDQLQHLQSTENQKATRQRLSIDNFFLPPARPADLETAPRHHCQGPDHEAGIR